MHRVPLGVSQDPFRVPESSAAKSLLGDRKSLDPECDAEWSQSRDGSPLQGEQESN